MSNKLLIVPGKPPRYIAGFNFFHAKSWVAGRALLNDELAVARYAIASADAWLKAHHWNGGLVVYDRAPSSPCGFEYLGDCLYARRVYRGEIEE